MSLDDLKDVEIEISFKRKRDNVYLPGVIGSRIPNKEWMLKCLLTEMEEQWNKVLLREGKA